MIESTFSKISNNIEKAAHIYAELRRTRPSTKRDLKNYVKVFLGIDIPGAKICQEHNSPMDYLWHSFSADFPTLRATSHERRATGNADAVIWANRAGGKTELAAVATTTPPGQREAPPEFLERRERVWRMLGDGARERYNQLGAIWQRVGVSEPNLHLNMIGVRR